MSIRNLAEANLEISTGQLLARGVSCSQENSTNEVSNFSTQTIEMLPFKSADVRNLLGPDLEEGQKNEMLGLNKECRDGFTLDTSELGKSNMTDMHINLQDDVSVTFPRTDWLTQSGLLYGILFSIY
jgi:hypothetical protein